MEDLFSTSIGINGKEVDYRVSFSDDKYVFHSDAEGNEFSTFSFRREHDEWMDEDLLPPALRTQAIDALEKYLLTQH